MKNYLTLLISVFLISFSLCSQDIKPVHTNRLFVGLGGESSMIGIDYSRKVYQSYFFLGIAAGIGGGWTGYVRYEPFPRFIISSFVSTGVSYAFNGTISASPNTSIYILSGGINILPKWNWTCVPGISIGATYYSLISGHVEGGLGGFGLLIKCGVAFGRKTKQQ